MARVCTSRGSSIPKSLPLDIQEEILLGLPVKTLSRFKCVCKPWYSLISSRLFQQHHNSHGWRQNNPLLLTTWYTLGTGFMTFHMSTYITKGEEGTLTPLNSFSKTIPQDIKFYVTSFTVHPILFCQGLICIRNITHKILLCNPATEELLALPPPPQPPSETLLDCIGFGYAASGKEFKVVRFYQTRKMGRCCEIFTFGKNNEGWRKARSSPPYDVRWANAPFLHGALHLPHSKYSEVGDNSYIAAFDLESEEYRESGISLPGGIPEFYFSDSKCGQVLTELGGSLCFCFSWTTRVELWILNKYHNGVWEKRHDIDLSTSRINIPITNTVNANPLGIMGNGRILLGVQWVFPTVRQLLCYNPKDNALKQTIEEYSNSRDCSAVLYVESFLPLGTR